MMKTNDEFDFLSGTDECATKLEIWRGLHRYG